MLIERLSLAVGDKKLPSTQERPAGEDGEGWGLYQFGARILPFEKFKIKKKHLRKVRGGTTCKRYATKPPDDTLKVEGAIALYL